MTARQRLIFSRLDCLVFLFVITLGLFAKRQGYRVIDWLSRWFCRALTFRRSVGGGFQVSMPALGSHYVGYQNVLASLEEFSF